MAKENKANKLTITSTLDFGSGKLILVKLRQSKKLVLSWSEMLRRAL